MNVEYDIKKLHNEIQQNITMMLLEKYKRICLYASVIDEGNASNGEMFFYYFPSGLLKKNPINVYEIPEMFNIDEEQYTKLEKRLYASIKKLKEYCIDAGQKNWSNITIIIEGIKYRVEYNYDDLVCSEFNNYSRHVIWRYKYLNIPIESFTKKEREIIERYFASDEYKNSKIEIYEDNIYEKKIGKIAEYDNVENHRDSVKNESIVDEENRTKNQLLNF